MATQHSRSAARLMMAPAVILLLGWMLVPLVMTLYFSFMDYRPLRGIADCCVGFQNYERFITSSSFADSVGVTLLMVGGILAITVVGGVLLAMLLVVMDMVLLRFRLRRELVARFPDDSHKGTTYYAITRAMQMRFMRLPKTQVKIGQSLPEHYR